MSQNDNLACLFRAVRADLVFMLHAYFDESGTDSNSAFTCVAGYVFDPEQCLRLDSEWDDALGDYGIKCFHMADCAHGIGEFKKLTKPERAELAARCIGIIKRRASAGFMCSISQADFKSFGTVHGFHDAYVMCAIWAMGGLAAWRARYGGDKKVSYFFERGARLQARVNAVMEWEQRQPWADACYQSHTFIKKQDARAIQAADLLAWEWQRELNNKFGQPRRPRRLSLRSLAEKTHLYSHLSREHALGLMLGHTADTLRQFHRLEPSDRHLNTVFVKPVSS